MGGEETGGCMRPALNYCVLSAVTIFIIITIIIIISAVLSFYNININGPACRLSPLSANLGGLTEKVRASQPSCSRSDAGRQAGRQADRPADRLAGRLAGRLAPLRSAPLRSAGWAGPGRAGPGRAGPGWAGLGWAGLGWALDGCSFVVVAVAKNSRGGCRSTLVPKGCHRQCRNHHCHLCCHRFLRCCRTKSSSTIDVLVAAAAAAAIPCRGYHAIGFHPGCAWLTMRFLLRQSSWHCDIPPAPYDRRFRLWQMSGCVYLAVCANGYVWAGRLCLLPKRSAWLREAQVPDAFQRVWPVKLQHTYCACCFMRQDDDGHVYRCS